MLKIPGILLLLFCLHAYASPETNLATDPEWAALLHLNRGATLHDRGKSYVDDPGFFLAPNGKQSAEAELEATIAALTPALSPARCRFPARYAFLARKLGWTDSHALDHCREYTEWRRQIPSARAVLVFPASYLNSPSSMFGHTLMRLDGSLAPENVWNSWAINYGAMTTGKENSMLYVWRGLAGGYPGHFSIVPYVSKIQEYSNLENRDIWEYALKLEPEEISRLIDHLWELQNINFDYYFFDENCAFRLLELVEIARPGENLIKGFRVTEEPVNTIRELYQHNLVTERIYRPSKASELQADIDALTPHERQMAKQLLDNPDMAASEAFQASAPQKQHLMARTALRTLRFKERKNDTSADVASRGLQLLRVMQANPAPSVVVTQPSPPDIGHSTQMFSLGGGQRGSSGFAELAYRLTYHDLLDNPQGFLKGAQIEGLNMRLRHTTQDNLRLEALDLINIRSLAPRNDFITPLSWSVQAGLEHADVYDAQRMVGFVQAGAGLSWRWGGLQPYTLASLRLEHNDGYKPLIETGAGSSLGLLWHLPGAQLNLMADGVYFENGEYRYRGQAGLNIPMGRQDGLRLQWRQDYWRGDHEQEYSLAWRHYFD